MSASKTRTVRVLTAVLAGGMLNVFWVDYFVLTDEFLHQALAESVPRAQAREMSDILARFWWVQYVVAAVTVVLRVGYCAACLALGFVFREGEPQVKRALRAAVHAETAYVAAAYVKTLWFVVTGVESLSEYYGFMPLSLLSWLGSDQVPPWSYYAFQVVNVFEACYWTIAAMTLRRCANDNVRTMMWLVVLSYGTGRVMFVTAITLLLVGLA